MSYTNDCILNTCRVSNARFSETSFKQINTLTDISHERSSQCSPANVSRDVRNSRLRFTR